MNKKIIAVFLIFISLTINQSFAVAGNVNNKKQNFPPNSIVLQKQTEDVTGDGNKDNVTLLGQKFENNSPYMKTLYLIVNTTMIKFPADSDGGYEPKFILKDFNGDKIPDIFVSAATGGSGGIINYHIFSVKEGKAKLIFSPTADSGINIEGSFQPNYKVKLTIKQTKKTYNFDFISRKSQYDDPNLKLYKNGKLLKRVDIWIDCYSLVTPVDIDKDGIFELQGIQQVSGIAHVDRLVEIKSTWKYVLDKWKLLKVDIKQLT